MITIIPLTCGGNISNNSSNNNILTHSSFKYVSPHAEEINEASSFANYDRQKLYELTKDVKLSKWSASSFLKTWHHTPISRAGKVKTTLYQECCNGDCTPNEVLETTMNQECCSEGCRYEEVLETCGGIKWDDVKK